MIRDKTILLEFLKSGLSTRQIDLIVGYKDSKGWRSWEVLKKYHLKDSYKGCLFSYSSRQVFSILDKLMKGSKLKAILRSEIPDIIKKYKGIKVTAANERELYSAVSGETRNLIRNFFSVRKKKLGICQFAGCKYKGELDTVHLFENRPSIFINCAKKFKIRIANKNEYDLYSIMNCFLMNHSRKDSICFLCKIHHNQLHIAEKSGKIALNNFRNKILLK
jgi:hypothetical protein